MLFNSYSCSAVSGVSMEDFLEKIRVISRGAVSDKWEWHTDRFHGGYTGVYNDSDEPICVPNCANDGDYGAAWFEDYLTEDNKELIAAAPRMARVILAIDEFLEGNHQPTREEIYKLIGSVK